VIRFDTLWEGRNRRKHRPSRESRTTTLPEVVRSGTLQYVLALSVAFRWRAYVNRGLATVDEAVRLATAEYRRRVGMLDG